MRWQAAVVGALASAFITTAAFAEVHIVDDPGGEVSEYVQAFHELRKAGEHLVIDGPCLSACTLFTGIIPHDHVCVTRRAVLGFHAASYFDDARHTLVPNRQGTQVICETRELQRLFDLLLDPSEDLRQYLSGDRNDQVQVARQLINILPAAAIIEILRYLIEDYWGRRAGWPDLFVYRDNEFFFAEVKSAGDKLGETQERWIRDNHQRLRFPFKLVEVLKDLEDDAAVGPGAGVSGGMAATSGRRPAQNRA